MPSMTMPRPVRKKGEPLHKSEDDAPAEASALPQEIEVIDEDVPDTPEEEGGAPSGIVDLSDLEPTLF